MKPRLTAVPQPAAAAQREGHSGPGSPDRRLRVGRPHGWPQRGFVLFCPWEAWAGPYRHVWASAVWCSRAGPAVPVASETRSPFSASREMSGRHLHTGPGHHQRRRRGGIVPAGGRGTLCGRQHLRLV